MGRIKWVPEARFELNARVELSIPRIGALLAPNRADVPLPIFHVAMSGRSISGLWGRHLSIHGVMRGEALGMDGWMDGVGEQLGLR